MQNKYDIIVAGAGSAGFCAAVQAGRLGKKVLLVEKNGMPGGILTVGGNNDIAQFYAHNKQVISGIGWEYVKRLEEVGGAVIPDMSRKGVPHWYYGVHVNIPLAAAMMDEMLLEAGVDICYEQVLCDVRTEKYGDLSRITEVKVTSKSGLVSFSADTYIDCTGDGDLSVFAGAEYELGTPDEHGLSLQPGTIRAFLGNHPLSDEEYASIDASLTESYKSGKLLPSDTMKRNFRSLSACRYNNTNHISRFNGADSHEKTLANIEGRRCVARVFAALRRAGINPDIESISPETAVRETRRIIADSYIVADDYVAARRYPDGICNSFYPIDLHRDGMGGIHQVFLEDGKVPSIPLSAMTVKGISNLFVAGRCISSDRLANSALRVKASCMAMGQACGAAAALASENGGETRGIDFTELRDILDKNGAILPEII
jgi:hypothetical protein